MEIEEVTNEIFNEKFMAKFNKIKDLPREEKLLLKKIVDSLMQADNQHIMGKFKNLTDTNGCGWNIPKDMKMFTRPDCMYIQKMKVLKYDGKEYDYCYLDIVPKKKLTLNHTEEESMQDAEDTLGDMLEG